jgi:transcriptional regulator with XRE-family HTH domain
MLSKIKVRQEYICLSLRSLSKELEVSPTLLSLVLNGKREPSKAMRKKLSSWLKMPVTTQSAYFPSALLDLFINVCSLHLAISTLDFYRGKLHPFAVWCESQQIKDVRMVRRANVSELLAFVRKWKSRSGKTLNQGSIKRYHQTLKT